MWKRDLKHFLKKWIFGLGSKKVNFWVQIEQKGGCSVSDRTNKVFFIYNSFQNMSKTILTHSITCKKTYWFQLWCPFLFNYSILMFLKDFSCFRFFVFHLCDIYFRGGCSSRNPLMGYPQSDFDAILERFGTGKSSSRNLLLFYIKTGRWLYPSDEILWVRIPGFQCWWFLLFTNSFYMFLLVFERFLKVLGS